VPAADVRGTVTGNTATLAWTPSSDTALIGYHVYRGATLRGPFTRLTKAPVAGTSFADTASVPGAVYMVRAIKLESTTSGSYENPAQGVFWSAGSASDIILAAANLPVRTPRATTTLSPDADPVVGSANATALTIASSGAATSRDSGPASGESAPQKATAPTGSNPPAIVNAPASSN
jgi:hypothetical protein